MSGQDESPEQLKNEINALRHRLAELEQLAERYKRVDDTLRFRESILRHIYDAVIVTNLEGKITYWNRGATAVFGYKSAGMLGRSLAAIIGFKPERWQTELDNLFAGQVFETQTTGHNKEGTAVSLEIRTSLLVDMDNSPLGFVSVIRDISDQQKAEAALAESQKRYEMAAAAGRVGVWDWDLRTNDMYLDPSLKAMLGYADDEIENHLDAWKSHAYEPDVGRAIASAEAHFLGKHPDYEAIHRMVHKDGSLRWFLARGALVRNGNGTVHLAGTQTDITEQMRAERALQRRNEELNLLNRAGHAFNSTLDLDEVLNTLLQEVRHFLDVVACSVWLVDSKTNDLVCRQVADAASASLRGHRLAPGQGFAGWVMAQGESLNITDTETDDRYFRGIDRKTGISLRSILTVPLKVKDRTIGVIQVVDTEKERFDEHDQMLVESLAAAAAAAIENARLYEQAAQDSRTKSLLLQEVNHRVKNNLAAIIGLLYAEQRQLSRENRPEMREVLQEMIARIQGLATVHRMLSASEWSPLSLKELVTQVIQTVLAGSQHGRLTEVIVSPSEKTVSAAQAGSLAVAINELTTNSLKYALPAVTHLIIEVEILEDEAGIVLTYRDNGPGFPESVLTSGHKNVGLYLVQTIVQEDLMGSTMLENDKGAVINIRFAHQLA